eukprot:TRINITY_DN12300_c0_g1_i1.p1 TRINITY_DN12300_c0_g1~~TRINITY_DN12300_c0_g1_i1.p1  ORF type:complete len:538 (+),score=179.95 TRINITY_DN12300_c0_g1_i1:118-1614(+)
MPLIVKTVIGKEITVTAPCGATVGVLKDKLAELEGTPRDRQRLIFSGRELKDDETLKDARVGNGAVVHLVTRLSTPSGPMRILVCIPNQRIVTLELERDDLVEHLKGKLSDQTGVPPEEMILESRKGKLLKNGTTLRDAGLEAYTPDGEDYVTMSTISADPSLLIRSRAGGLSVVTVEKGASDTDQDAVTAKRASRDDYRSVSPPTPVFPTPTERWADDDDLEDFSAIVAHRDAEVAEADPAPAVTHDGGLPPAVTPAAAAGTQEWEPSCEPGYPVEAAPIATQCSGGLVGCDVCTQHNLQAITAGDLGYICRRCQKQAAFGERLYYCSTCSADLCAACADQSTPRSTPPPPPPSCSTPPPLEIPADVVSGHGQWLQPMEQYPMDSSAPWLGQAPPPDYGMYHAGFAPDCVPAEYWGAPHSYGDGMQWAAPDGQQWAGGPPHPPPQAWASHKSPREQVGLMDQLPALLMGPDHAIKPFTAERRPMRNRRNRQRGAARK